ncbi:MAG: hypothetical protein GXY70_00295, partial [Euryarchaeota archaeon]|nr:hypothetical protein [Euryarchaeota archaeon]
KLGEAWDGMAKWFECGIAEIGEAIGGFGTWLWNSITGAIGLQWSHGRLTVVTAPKIRHVLDTAPICLISRGIVWTNIYWVFSVIV